MRANLVISGLMLLLIVWAGASIVGAVGVYALEVAYDRSERHVPRGEFGTSPPDCDEYYNVGRSREWQECMGVGPK